MVYVSHVIQVPQCPKTWKPEGNYPLGVADEYEIEDFLQRMVIYEWYSYP